MHLHSVKTTIQKRLNAIDAAAEKLDSLQYNVKIFSSEIGNTNSIESVIQIRQPMKDVSIEKLNFCKFGHFIEIYLSYVAIH